MSGLAYAEGVTQSAEHGHHDLEYEHEVKEAPYQFTETLEQFQTSSDNDTAMLYREGRIVLIPAPSADPRDPLNMTTTRKFIAITSLCCFGALAAAAELILGAMLPVFALEYAGINPHYLTIITSNGGLPAGSDPLKELSQLPNAPPIWKVYLLASLPVLMMGLANLILVPLAISCGRRFILLACGVTAIVGAVWAGNSHSLNSHLAARCLQALGAGTVESLIPFILQDMVFVHQRNTAISGVFAVQGLIIVGLGIAAPYIIIGQTWRWVYFYTSIGAAVFLTCIFFFLPETRWHRTHAEMNGEKPAELKEQDPRASRVMLDYEHHEPRTWSYDLKLFQGEMEWNKGWQAFLDTMRTFFYPHIFFITMLNSAMIATAFAAGYTVSPALLTAPYSWKFLHIGYCLISVLIAAILTYIIAGQGADVVANWVAKKRGKRVPENQILNLVLPTACGIIGAVIFGLAGEHQDKYPWPVFLLGLGLMAFGFLSANTVGAVYVLESYPHLAGPALVNIASFRCLIAFVLSFRVSEWIANLGYLKSFTIYACLMSVFAALLPVVYYFGPSWRKRWPADWVKTY